MSRKRQSKSGAQRKRKPLRPQQAQAIAASRMSPMRSADEERAKNISHLEALDPEVPVYELVFSHGRFLRPDRVELLRKMIPAVPSFREEDEEGAEQDSIEAMVELGTLLPTTAGELLARLRAELTAGAVTRQQLERRP